jgi:UDP-N-acetylglucosamine 2-epimerase (non-hydrolysing)
LLREGVPNNRITVTGNPILEVINHYREQINASMVLEQFGLTANEYIVATAHRAENVDNDIRLLNIFQAFEELSTEYKIVFSCHPRTEQKLKSFNINVKNSNIIISKPFGFFDFIKLEQNATMSITDSGTVQEEMCIFKIPTVTIRDTTERPETVWCGSNIVSGLNKADILKAVNSIRLASPDWKIPEGYDVNNVSDVVVNILLGK